jgi:glycosyltransferase involved in cell wall biosynthesis
MYKTLSEHTFYLVDNNIPFIGRDLPDNAKIVSWDDINWDEIDLGYAVSIERFNSVREKGKPCVFHIDQVPQSWDNPKKLNELLNGAVCFYWSEEEAEMWDAGTKIVRPHPIDTNIFEGYNPTKEMAITVATRAFSGWGPDLKGYKILKDAYRRVPIQVIAKGDTEFDNAIGINSEKDMIDILKNHQVYFNCAWKLDRSPLEAMGVGLPIIAIKTKFNVYKKYLNEESGNIVYADDMLDMVAKTKKLLSDKLLAKEIGLRGRETIKAYWNPELSRFGWNEGFKLALEGK